MTLKGRIANLEDEVVMLRKQLEKMDFISRMLMWAIRDIRSYKAILSITKDNIASNKAYELSLIDSLIKTSEIGGYEYDESTAR